MSFHTPELTRRNAGPERGRRHAPLSPVMADPALRLDENVPGDFYVDSTCIDCDVCRDTAPENFCRSDANSYSFVYKQPLTEEEIAACEEAVLCCPVEAIGNDGEQETAE